MIAETTTVARHPEALSTEVGEKTLLMSLETGNYHELDDIGSHVWVALDSPKTVAELRDSLLAAYEVTPEQCLADLVRFLEEMKAIGAIRLDA